jgi:tetratricopeptide (TPR) repeat protein
MNRDNGSDQRLREMLRELPGREPPSGLAGRIMAEIDAPPESLGRKIAGLLTRAFPRNVRPMRAASLCGVVLLAFWLGMTAAGHRSHTGGGTGNGVSPLAGLARSGEANYFLGRALFAEEQWEEAAEYLRRAAELTGDNPEYALWAGVALGKLGDREREREMYRQTVSRHPDYVPARMYLGHTLLESGEAAAALEEYSRVLALVPDEEVALYNRALAVRELGDREQASAAWKEYLRLNRTGKWAYRAVEHLNALGDFTYRGYRIGHRRIIVNQGLLLGPDSEARRREIVFLSSAFAQATGEVLNLVVFQAGDPAQAGIMARELQYLLDGSLDGQAGKRIDISWFGEPEQVRTASGEGHVLREGLLLFCIPQVNQTGEKMI